MVHFKIVFKVLGILLIMLSLMLLFPLIFALINRGSEYVDLGTAALCSLGTGILFWLLFRDAKEKITKREGYLIVALGWITISIYSAIPYLSYAGIGSTTDAFFESISGLTTTGATILTDIELPTLPLASILSRIDQKTYCAVLKHIEYAVSLRSTSKASLSS